MLLSSEPVRKPSHPASQRLHRPGHHIKSKSLNQSQVQSQSIQYLTLPKNIMRSNTATVNETHLEPIDHVKSLNHLTLEQLQNSRRTIALVSPPAQGINDPLSKYPVKAATVPLVVTPKKPKSPRTPKEINKPAPIEITQPSRVEINFHTDLSPLEAIKVKAEAQMKKGAFSKPKEVTVGTPQKPNIHEPLQQRFQDVDLRWIEELEVINQDLLQFENTLGYDKQELENKFIEQINEDKERAKHKSVRNKAKYTQTLNSKVMPSPIGIQNPSQNPQFNDTLKSNTIRLRASSSEEVHKNNGIRPKEHRLSITQPRSYSPPANANSSGLQNLFSPKDSKTNLTTIESPIPSQINHSISSQSQQFPNHLLMRLETLEKELKKEKKLRKSLQTQLVEEQEKNKKLVSKLHQSKMF